MVVYATAYLGLHHCYYIILNDEILGCYTCLRRGENALAWRCGVAVMTTGGWGQRAPLLGFLIASSNTD
jgi:hypothetical protein